MQPNGAGARLATSITLTPSRGPVRVSTPLACHAGQALQAVALGLLEDHLGACVTDAVRKGGDEGAESVREASEAIKRLVRS